MEEKTKVCRKCNISKTLSEYYKEANNSDGLRHECKACKFIQKQLYEHTLHGALVVLINRAKSSANERLNNGRIQAGICDIILQDLKDLWDFQEGRCYYSGIPMNYDKRDWKVSLERKDNDYGYIKTNIALICFEFNHASQWSHDKFKEMSYILSQNIESNYVNFDMIKKDLKNHIRIKKIIIDNIEYYNCTYCGIVKSVNEFGSRNKNNYCKECVSQIYKEKKLIPIEVIKELYRNAKTHTNDRIKKKDNKRDNSFDITIEFLIQLYNVQKGLCAYSELPLQFGNYEDKNWTISLERKNPLLGYVKDNVCFTCWEMNCVDQITMHKNKELGSSGWTKEKFEILKSYLFIQS
jgi:hypothetical protein